MKFIIQKPIEIDIKFLDVYFGEYVYPEDIEYNNDNFETIEEFLDKYPQFKNNPGDFNCAQFFLRIDIETGKVVNFPENGIPMYLTNVKIVDSGTYILKDSNLKDISVHEGYVPACLSIEEEGFGDYVEIIINKDGYINDWEFTQEDVDELFEIS